MAKRWFPGTVFGFCSGTLLVIGLTSLRTDHQAIGKQASWSQPSKYETTTEENPWLEMEDESWNDLAETDEIDEAVMAEDKAAEDEFTASDEAAENRLEPASDVASCPVEEFFSRISEFRYRYLFQGRDELGFFPSEQTPSAAKTDAENEEKPSYQSQVPEIVFEEAEPRTEASRYGFYDNYGPSEQFSASVSWSDGAAESSLSGEAEEIAGMDAVEEEMAEESAAMDSQEYAAELPGAEIDDYRDYVDYEALYGDYYEEAEPQDVVGGRPWMRRRNARQVPAPTAGEAATSAKAGVIQFPTLAEYAQVHVEEDWEARVAEGWILARNDATLPQSDDLQTAAEDRPLNDAATMTADAEASTDALAGDDFEMVRDESLEPLYQDYEEAWMSGEVSLPSPEQEPTEAAPVWDTPMHGEPGEDFQWEDAAEETTVEFPTLPRFESVAESMPNAEATFEAQDEAAWDLETPGYSPAANSDEVSHVYEGDYYQSEKYRYFVYEEGYRGWKELNAALSEGENADSVRLEVVLPALLRAMDSVPEFLSRTVSDARRNLADSLAWLLNRPRTAAKPDSTSVK